MSESVCSLRILLIEDNDDFSFLLSTLLETMGHECIPAYDGIEGIQKAKEILPDVIFCDIGLPEIDGFEVVKVMKADDTLKDICVVALTGYAGNRDLDKAAESGFNYHIAKPVDMALMKQLLHEVQHSRNIDFDDSRRLTAAGCEKDEQIRPDSIRQFKSSL